MDRREQITNEVWSAITHGIGVGLSIWLLVLLILKGSQRKILSVLQHI